jgi:hypothetical protein
MSEAQSLLEQIKTLVSHFMNVPQKCKR